MDTKPSKEKIIGVLLKKPAVWKRWRKTIYSRPDLRRADLGGANLGGADLRRADLGGAKLSWESHQLLSEILFRAAGDDVDRRMIAGLIRISPDWCWVRFLHIKHPQRTWAIGELAKWVQDDDGAPRVIARYARMVKAQTA